MTANYFKTNEKASGTGIVQMYQSNVFLKLPEIKNINISFKYKFPFERFI
jgi:hypothetical protein